MNLTLIEAARLVAASHVLLLSLLSLRSLRGWNRISASMMGPGVAAFLLIPILIRGGVPLPALVPLYILQVAMTFWFWLFAFSLTDDSFRPTWKHWSVLPLKFVISLLWFAPGRRIWLPLSPDETLIWRATLPTMLSLGLAFWAVWIVRTRLPAELEEGSRRLQVYLVYWGAGALVLTVLLLAVMRGPVLERVGEWLLIAAIVGACFRLHFLFWHGAETDSEPPLPTGAAAIPGSAIHEEPGASPSPSQADRVLADRILACFAEEEYYRREGLTLKDLSVHIEVKEYLVRRAINRALGYRNFNQFVNAHRISAAQRSLTDDPELPVVRIALDLGYRSLAGFNKAFKEIAGRTPTEYRRARNDGPESSGTGH